ncbi:MAG: hypothetical protein ACLFVH_13170 [Phycisphaerae bacterium]
MNNDNPTEMGVVLSQTGPLRLIRWPSGQTVFQGLFQMYDQEGFPLMMSLDQCRRFGHLVDWCDFYRSAHHAGWPFKRTRALVEEAIVDADWPQTFMQTVRFASARTLGCPAIHVDSAGTGIFPLTTLRIHDLTHRVKVMVVHPAGKELPGGSIYLEPAGPEEKGVPPSPAKSSTAQINLHRALSLLGWDGHPLLNGISEGNRIVLQAA